jgi:hypothetical protein
MNDATQKITEIDRNTCKKIREILDRELPGILEPYGVSFDLGNIRFDDDSMNFTSFRLSVEGAKSEDEKALERELAARAEYDWMVTLDATKIVEKNGMSLRLVGYRSRNRKYPFITEDVSNGKRYKLSEENTEEEWASSEQASRLMEVKEFVPRNPSDCH